VTEEMSQADFWQGYEERAQANVDACERILKQQLSEDDKQAIGLMVYRQIIKERKLGKKLEVVSQ
jgi:hypothetical protein